MRDKIKTLIEEYEDIKESYEQDRKNDNMLVSNAFKVAKIGVYAKVIEDLKELMEGEENGKIRT